MTTEGGSAVMRVECPAGRRAEREYAATVVLGEQMGVAFELVEAERDDVEITLGGHEGRLVRMPDQFLGRVSSSDWLTPAGMPSAADRVTEPSPLGAPRAGHDLPVILGTTPSAPLAVARDGRVDVGIDVFGSAVFMLGRYEELASPAADRHGRFPFSASAASAGGYAARPLLDEYVELLRAALNHVWPGLAAPAPPTTVALSHDVDFPLCTPRGLAGLRTAAGDLARRRAPGLAARRVAAMGPWARRGSRRLDPCNTFGLMLEATEAAGLRSAYYFMAEGTHPLDGDYRLDDPWVIDLIARIAGEGHEVGLHPSYRTSDEPELVEREFERLRRACSAAGVTPERWGGRQHFLRWTAPDSWLRWDAAGLDYDSSVGWSETIGFRSGTSREHPVFDLRSRRMLRLRERPLVVMEAALLDNGVPAAEVPDRVAAIRAAVTAVGGELSLLWHNSRLQERRQVRAFRRSLAAATGT